MFLLPCQSRKKSECLSEATGVGGGGQQPVQVVVCLYGTWLTLSERVWGSFEVVSESQGGLTAKTPRQWLSRACSGTTFCQHPSLD